MSRYKPVLIHVDPDEWPKFQELCGSYKASARLRELVKEEIKKHDTRPVQAR